MVQRVNQKMQEQDNNKYLNALLLLFRLTQKNIPDMSMWT